MYYICACIFYSTYVPGIFPISLPPSKKNRWIMNTFINSHF